MNVLLVDDELHALSRLEKAVREAMPGATVEKADNYSDAVRIAEKERIYIAFLDIRLPGKDGLELAEKLQTIRHDTNIIMVTAFKEYGYAAVKTHVSDYLLKPVSADDIREALKHLRYPEDTRNKGLYVRCFGNFEVFYNGEPFKFGRKLSKEIFAYLIDRKGAAVSTAQICAAIWEDDSDDKNMDYCRHVLRDLKVDLEDKGCGDILSFNRNSYGIRYDKVHCDYYEALDAGYTLADYRGEYMSQYSWAEYTIGSFV